MNVKTMIHVHLRWLPVDVGEDIAEDVPKDIAEPTQSENNPYQAM